MTTIEFNLTERLEAFIENHPDGWDHTEWLALLAELRQAGVDREPDEIGWLLENERLAAALRGFGVRGLGPKRIDAVVQRFGSLWNLRQASPEAIADIDIIPSKLAGSVRAALD
jgi:hypothetical protein